jgi:ATP-dependent helicase HrpA
VPRSADDLAARLDTRRAQLDEMAERLAKQVTGLLREWRAIRSALQNLPSGPFAAAIADINTQLQILLPADFIESTPRPWFDYLPRYLRTIVRRIERLSGNARRDSELAAKVKPFVAGLLALEAQPRHTASTPELTQLRWMIEEYRVSLFAQDLKAMLRVSDKRLAEQLAAARAEAGG